MPRRRPSLPTVAVWLGAIVVLAMGVCAAARPRASATQQSERAAISARVSEAYRHAHDAHTRQESRAERRATPPRTTTPRSRLRTALLRRRRRARPGGASRSSSELLRDHTAYLIAAEHALRRQLGRRRRRPRAGGAARGADRRRDRRGGATTRSSSASPRTPRSAASSASAALMLVADALIFGALGVMLRQQRRRLDAARAAGARAARRDGELRPAHGPAQPPRLPRGPRAASCSASRARASRWRSCCSTSTTSRRSTTTHGHQAGDERIRALADALRATMRGTDQRVPHRRRRVRRHPPGHSRVGRARVRAASARRAARLHRHGGHRRRRGAAPARRAHPRGGHGAARRQARCTSTPRSTRSRWTPTGDEPRVDERHTRTLASALARAVDAKDSYTRSHCQTVSQLAALIAAELGFTGDRLARMRLAGLLHDVGKIGVPDAILNKPAALTDDEYVVMQAPLDARLRDRAGRRAARGGALGAPPPRARGRPRLPGRARRRRDPARVAHHPRRRRVRGDDVRPPLPARARPRVRGRRNCSAAPAPSSTRTSSTRSAACSTACPSRSRVLLTRLPR